MTVTVSRFDLQQLAGISPKLLRAFEQLFVDTAAAGESAEGAVQATGAIQNATVITLSANAAFANERILTLDPFQFQVVDEGPSGALSVTLVSFILLNGGFPCTFNLEADTNLDLPTSGRVLTGEGLSDYADDAAAAGGGVAVGHFYRTGSSIKVRVS